MYGAADLRCVRRISSIVADTASPAERAEGVLDELFHLIPYAAAQICTWDDQRQTHYTIAARGYPTAVRTALNGSRYRDDLVYREGGTVLLRDSKRGYIGMLVMNLETYQAPAEAEQALLGIVGAGLAPLVDRFHLARRIAAACAPHRAAAVYHAQHGWVDICGEGLPPARLLEVLGIPGQTDLPTRSSWRDPGAQSSRTRIDGMTSIGYEIYPIHDKNCEVLLTWGREAAPYHLTAREAEVALAADSPVSEEQKRTAPRPWLGR